MRESVGGELTKITKTAIANLMNDEEGDVITKQHPGGDVQLLTKHPPILLGIEATIL